MRAFGTVVRVVIVRTVESDADHAAWRRVRLTVVPDERAASVAELRAAATPTRLLVLAEEAGEVVGSGSAEKSDLAGAVSVHPRVLPHARRRGVGTALLRALAGHAAALPFERIASDVTDAGSLAFADRFGFVEVDRQVEQVRTIGVEPSAPAVEGVQIVAVSAQPHRWQEAYATVGREAFADMAVSAPMEVSPDAWQREWITDPDAMFVALADGVVIGVAGLLPDDDQPHRAEHALTAVLRAWRGRGVAVALKRTVLHWAATHGIREVYTWTQRGNDAMRQLNTRLGYTTRTQSIRVEAPLPLTLP